MPRTELGKENLYDPEVALRSELNQVKDNQAVPTVFDPVLMNNYELYQKILEGGGAPGKNIVVSMGDANQSYWYETTKNWDAARVFYFGGTAALGTPSYFKIVASMTNGYGQVRLWDVTNSQQLAIITYTANTPTVFQTGTFTNLPSGEVVVEVQGREDPAQGGSYVRLYMAGIIY